MPSPTFPRVLPRDVMAATISESDLLQSVLEYARIRGWLAHHCRPGLNRRGMWSTAVQGDAGMPDLCLVRNGRVVLAELKTERGKTTPEQEAWLAAAKSPSDTVIGVVWRPSDWRNGTIEAVLA